MELDGINRTLESTLELLLAITAMADDGRHFKNSSLHTFAHFDATSVLVCSLSLLIRGLILPAVREKFHLSSCSDSSAHLA
jgi:hypothetical protein